MQKVFNLLLFLFLVGCDFGDVVSTKDPAGPKSAGIISPASVSVGDSVEVIAGGADVYDIPNGAVVDFAPAGSAGIVTRIKTDWAQVDFTSSFAGDVVLASMLSEIGGDPPDTTVTGDLGEVLIFGCSNASNLADGVNTYSAVLTSNGGSPGNRGKTIINYGEASSGNSMVFDHVRQDLTPDVDAVIYLGCHRFDYTGQNRPGARLADVPYFLPADSSGSTQYGELELVRRTAINTRQVLDDNGHASTPLYMIALHDYDPAGSCARVGEYIPTMLRAAIAILVSEGLVTEMTYNGGAFKLLELTQPGDTTSEGCHISGPGQSKLVNGNPGGGLDDWAAENQ